MDADALHSIAHDAPAPPELDVTKKGWVKLIDKSWYLGRSEDRERLLESIEGVTEPDVGWVKVAYQNVMTDWYIRAGQRITGGSITGVHHRLCEGNQA